MSYIKFADKNSQIEGQEELICKSWIMDTFIIWIAFSAIVFFAGFCFLLWRCRKSYKEARGRLK